MANIELRDIDEHIAKLQELRRIMSDPAMATVLNQLLASKNGHSSPPLQNRQNEYKAKTKGNFIRQIEKICEYFGLEPFTIRDVIQAFEAGGYTFKAKDKNVATYSALQRLVERGVLKIVVRGIGAKPSTYQMNVAIPK
jgi:hypothetical protein